MLFGLSAAILSPAAFAQDTGDTGDAQELQVALEVREGSVLTPVSEGGEIEPVLQIKRPHLLTLRAPPSLAEGVNVIPGGSLVLLRKEEGKWEPRLVPAKAFLLPEPMYDKALIQAKQLKICQPALDAVSEEALKMADRTYTALSKCDGQFDVDEVLIADLTGQVGSWETRALVAEDRLKVSRRNQAVAWAITGGLVLGASAAIVLTVSN